MAYDDDYEGIEDEMFKDASNMAGNRTRFAEDEPVKIDSNGDTIVEETVETVKEEAKETPKEKQEQIVRVVVDQPKPKKKKKEDSFDEGLTPEEKAEWKHTRLEEKRATLAERKLRLSQRKRNVEDNQFREVINPNQIGVYRRAKIVASAVAPRQQPQVRVESSARGFSAEEMVGRVKSVRSNPPYNPVVASQGNRANYFAGYQGSRGVGVPMRGTHPVVASRGLHANYYASSIKRVNPQAPSRSPSFSLNAFKRKSNRNVKFKSRWSI